MLAGERAAGVDAGVEDRSRQPLGPLGLAFDRLVVEHERMQVAVAGVEDARDPQAVLLGESSAVRRSTSGSRVRGTTPSWT